jgi:hypothetical protein
MFKKALPNWWGFCFLKTLIPIKEKEISLVGE